MMVKILKIIVYFFYRFLSFCKFLPFIFFWSIKNRTLPFFWEVQKNTMTVKKLYKKRNYYIIWNLFMTFLSFFGYWIGFFIDSCSYKIWLIKKKLQILLEKVEFVINKVQKRKEAIRLAFYRYFLKKIVFFYGWLEIIIPIYLFIPFEKWLVSVSSFVPILLNQNQSRIRLSYWEVETYFSRPIQILFRNLTEKWICFFRSGREKKMFQFQNFIVEVPLNYGSFLEKLVCFLKKSLLNKTKKFYSAERKISWANFFLKSKKNPFFIKVILVEESHWNIVFCWKWLYVDYFLKKRFLKLLNYIENIQNGRNNQRLKWLENLLFIVVFVLKLLDLPLCFINKLVYNVFFIIFRSLFVLIEMFKFRK